MTDDAFETTLRAWLAGRATTGAGVTLRARIAAVPTDGGSSRVAPIRRPGRWLASIGLAASLVIGLAWLATRAFALRPRVGPGASGDAMSSFPPLDPTVEGVGVVDVGFSPLPVIVVAAVVVGLAVVIWRTRRRWVRAFAGGALVLVVAAVSTISNASWIGFGPTGAWATGLGFDHWGTETQSVAGSDQAFFHVRPGEPFTFSFTLTNHAPVPITVEGLVPDAPNLGFRLTGLGLQRPIAGVDPDGWAVSADVAESVPFTPIQIQPDQYRLIVVTGKAGPCAGGWEAGTNATGMSFDRITLAYSAVGAERTEQVPLPLTVEIPIVEGCTG
jgi:hypothetical protein